MSTMMQTEDGRTLVLEPSSATYDDTTGHYHTYEVQVPRGARWITVETGAVVRPDWERIRAVHGDDAIIVDNWLLVQRGDALSDAERIDWQDYLDEAHREKVDDEAERFPGWRR